MDKEPLEIRCLMVKEDDEEAVEIKLTASDQDSLITKAIDLVSDNDEPAYFDLREIIDGNPNILLMSNSKQLVDKSGYNFTVQIFPFFGSMLFLEYAMGNDSVILVDMSDENLKKFKNMIKTQKENELKRGNRQAVIDRVNQIGKERYMKDLMDRYNYEDEYDKAKNE